MSTIGSRCYLNKIRQFHLLPLVIDGMPVRNMPHALLAGSEPLAERAKLRIRVATPVWVVETHVQEERPEN